MFRTSPAVTLPEEIRSRITRVMLGMLISGASGLASSATSPSAVLAAGSDTMSSPPCRTSAARRERNCAKSRREAATHCCRTSSGHRGSRWLAEKNPSGSWHGAERSPRTLR